MPLSDKEISSSAQIDPELLQVRKKTAVHFDQTTLTWVDHIRGTHTSTRVHRPQCSDQTSRSRCSSTFEESGAVTGGGSAAGEDIHDRRWRRAESKSLQACRHPLSTKSLDCSFPRRRLLCRLSRNGGDRSPKSGRGIRGRLRLPIIPTCTETSVPGRGHRCMDCLKVGGRQCARIGSHSIGRFHRWGDFSGSTPCDSLSTPRSR